MLRHWRKKIGNNRRNSHQSQNLRNDAPQPNENKDSNAHLDPREQFLFAYDVAYEAENSCFSQNGRL
ncbi:hypothetical protein TNCT_502181 [Trichonephila clavata]|uniref:Uncharacterized protein n=1 Tax=Trichonephila clavata TaxID=2740835 RepID=A0A8X6H2I6_TRICU|nr:hypothetical protein TNCT_502181 [Trichonephila clavata]